MRFAGFGIVLVALIVSNVLGTSFQQAETPKSSLDQNSTIFAKKDGLIAIKLDGSDARDQIAIIDPKKKSLATYQVNKANGEISLKSVRSIHWDLQLDEFNGTSPTPKQIQSIVEK